MDDKNINIYQSRQRWKTRRAMASISLLFIALIAACCFMFSKQAAESASILSTIVFIFGSVVLGYLGFSTFDDKWHKKEDAGAK